MSSQFFFSSGECGGQLAAMEKNLRLSKIAFQVCFSLVDPRPDPTDGVASWTCRPSAPRTCLFPIHKWQLCLCYSVSSKGHSIRTPHVHIHPSNWVTCVTPSPVRVTPSEHLMSTFIPPTGSLELLVMFLQTPPTGHSSTKSAPAAVTVSSWKYSER